MTNHQNRAGRNAPASNPLPATIKAQRESAGLSTAQAAAVIHSSPRAWQQWEAGERRMHPAMWELFQLKVWGGRP